ncbi:MAG TPA: mechanosensitive ion channel domain-containing protein, partial [Casimicrobiaceae bacterium]|nr:mechanosensitive ion channel domain-containing protein [Casimicrobiaceae bacterium]
IGDRMRLLHQLERSLAQRLDSQGRHAHVVEARRNAEARADNWRGFADPPPYSLAFVDSLEQAQETIEQQIATIESRETVLNALMQRLQRRLRDSEAELRLASERFDGASADTEQRRRAKWLRDLAQLRSEEAAAALDEVQQGRTNATEEKGAAQADLRLTKAQLAVARAATRFTKDDLDRIDARLAGESKTLAGELDRQTAGWKERKREADDAAKRLGDARKAGALPAESPEAFDARIAALDREADVSQRRAENANLALDGAKTQLALIDYEHKAWTMRYELMQSHDLVRESAAYENLVNSLAGLQAWNEYQKQQLDNAASFVATLDSRLRGASGAEAVALRAMRDVYVDRGAILRSSLSATQPLERLLLRWRANAGNADAPRSFVAHIGDIWVFARLWVKHIWDFELFSVEDSFETAEGRKIVAQRSVTIGKTVGALTLIVLGSWLCAKLAQLAGWLAIRMFRQTPAYANIIYRWTLALLVALLVVASFLAVQIPLTAFAFIGGALAIGVGFGAQNLLKNLMSGVMLLIEKPLRVGDLIEFGGVRGRVTNIGFRASVVRTADGIEALIPNSTFIESNVTNLTYSSTEMRQKIVIGVAYGADPAVVRQALIAVARDHPEVLKNLEPAAYFDEFGDDAQKFRLTYWIDVGPELDMARIATELREAILQRLTTGGIGIPFPQRTLHVDTPVRVEITQARKDA